VTEYAMVFDVTIRFEQATEAISFDKRYHLAKHDLYSDSICMPTHKDEAP
jgi:hypothetical protein